MSGHPHAVNLHKTNLGVQPDARVAGLIFRDAALSAGLPKGLAEAARTCKAHGDCEPNDSEAECAVCHAYWLIMSKCNRVDYDDQVLLACRILEGDAALLAEYRSRCRHLLVDEYQDINAAQFRLIKLLSAESLPGLFAVGDDAQSIYGFRGAGPDFILRFTEDFPDAWAPPLAYSRRCHEGILTSAQAALEKLYSGWHAPTDIEYTVEKGREPGVWRARSEKAEATWVARLARDAVTEDKTVLVLVPKKAFFPLLARALGRFGVAYDCQEDLLPSSVRQRLTVVWQLLHWVGRPKTTSQRDWLSSACWITGWLVCLVVAGGVG